MALPKQLPSDTSVLDGRTIAFLGLVATIPILGYQFGIGNQVEQFPLIQRLRDPDFAPGDFYIDGAVGFGPRYYYAVFIAFLLKIASLPAVVFALTLVCNFGTAIITYLSARKFLRGSMIVGVVAAVLALTNSGFSLGLAGYIRFESFQPASIAIPLSLFGIYLLFSNHCFLAILPFSLASIVHPLIGTESGVFAYFAFLLATFIHERNSDFLLEKALRQFVAGLIFVAIVFLAWGVPTLLLQAEKIPDAEFFSILVIFRSPHHYLATQFPPSHFVSFLLFVFFAGFLIWQFIKDRNIATGSTALIILVVTVIVLCAASIVFVDMLHDRMWATAQLYRILYLVKWVGYLFVALLAARWLSENSFAGNVFAVLILVVTANAQPIALALCLTGKTFIEAMELRRNWTIIVTLVVALLCGIIAYRIGADKDFVRACVAVICLFLVYQWISRPYAGVCTAYAVLISLIAFSFFNKESGLTNLPGFKPTFTWSDLDNPESDIARWVRANTPHGEIWATPPHFEAFRLMAERAVIVEFTSIPFDDMMMREWKVRMTKLYGEVDSTGFSALNEMKDNYRSTTSAELSHTMDLYGANYAVLYADTPWKGAELYQNEVYKVVRRTP